MQHVSELSLWRTNFVGALRLLGEAAAHLPYGVPDPIICGTAAVELYTGGLWQAADLELLAADARPLTAELFAVGFRWTERPRCRGGLWHPEFEIGVDVHEGLTALLPAAARNVVTVALDTGWPGSSDAIPISVKVIGIEDLLAEQIALWVARRAPAGEISVLIQVLNALGRAGVGGRLRAAYLQRRLAWETNGEVVLEPSSAEEGVASDPTPRSTTLTRVQGLISTWRAQCGLSFDAPGARGSSGDPQAIRHRNGRPARGGRSCEKLAQVVVPFDAALSVPPG
jgi:hypothetical protein